MLHICIFSNKLDLIQATSVSHNCAECCCILVAVTWLGEEMYTVFTLHDPLVMLKIESIIRFNYKLPRFAEKKW